MNIEEILVIISDCVSKNEYLPEVKADRLVTSIHIPNYNKSISRLWRRRRVECLVE